MKRGKQAILLLLASLLLVLSACGGNSSSPSGQNGGASPSGENGGEGGSGGKSGSGERIQLTFWDFHTEAEQEFFERMVAEYNAIQDRVEIVYSTSSQSDYTTAKLPIAFTGGNGPDIFMISPGDFMKFANAGWMLDLTPYFPEGALEDFLPASIEAVTVDGKILALPYELELLALYYNEEMLKNAGVDVPRTWDELLDAARKLSTDTVAGLILPADKEPYFNFVWYPFLWQNGGNVLSEDGKTSLFNTPEVAEALDFWGTFFREGLSPTKLQQHPAEIDHIGSGTAAMQIVGTWAINRLEQMFGDMPINVAPIPYPADGKPATDAGGWKFAVNANSKYPEEAAKFIMWVFAEDPERALEWATEIKFAYSPRQSVVEAGKEIYNKGLRKVFTEQIYDTAIPEPRYPAQVVDIVGDALQEVMFGRDAAEAAEDAHQKLTKALQELQ
jgi:multiple sugar transport system substrate-binding protein